MPDFSTHAARIACSVLMLGLILPLTACKEKTTPATAAKALSVQTVTVRSSSETVWAETLGKTEGITQSDVRAQVAGILKKINYQEGSPVKAGDVLFTLDDAQYQTVYLATKAEAEQARANCVQSERDLRRNKKLLAARTISQKAFDDSRSTHESNLARLSALRAKAQEAKINLDRTRVKAPVSGIALRANVNPGTLVTATTTVLTQITQPEKLRIHFNLSEKDLQGIKPTLASPIRVFDASHREIPARLDYVSPSLDPGSATLAMRATLLDSGSILAGQYLTVQLGIRELAGVYRVPQKAIYQKPDGSYILYKEIDGKATAVTVTVGAWKDTDWMILSGLNEGDRVIVNQLQRLKNGLSVQAKAAH